MAASSPRRSSPSLDAKWFAIAKRRCPLNVTGGERLPARAASGAHIDSARAVRADGCPPRNDDRVVGRRAAPGRSTNERWGVGAVEIANTNIPARQPAILIVDRVDRAEAGRPCRGDERVAR